ncbi:MAG: hypothetical protein ACLUVX_08945 [Lachnospira pectinoschiza]|jgi:hypothetical protein
MVKLKVGRDILNIDNNDLILDNGACYQIITKEKNKGFKSYPVRMSKKLFNDLKKYDLIFTNEGLKQDAIKRYSVLNVTYWKFNIEKMQKLGY